MIHLHQKKNNVENKALPNFMSQFTEWLWLKAARIAFTLKIIWFN